MSRSDPYTPDAKRFECPGCGGRHAENAAGTCPDCGHELRNISVPRE